MKFAAVKVPPVPAVVLAIISVQVGAAIAKGLFATLGAAGTASARIGFSALILFIAVRPNLFRLTAKQWRAVVPYGLALGLMNLLFYYALSRLPMGLAVALEFVGPLGLALAGSRKALDLLWVALAGIGIALVAPWSGKGVDLVGVIFALSAGACWAFYILLSKRAGTQLPGQLAVAVGMLCAAILVLPMGIADVDFSRLNIHILVLGLTLAVFSSVFPFSLEMQALRSMPPRTFSILMSLEPAVAAFLGWVLLSEQLKFEQWLAILCIVTASFGVALKRRRSE